MGRNTRGIDEILESLLPKSPFASGLRVQKVLESWSEIAGEEIARHSRAVGIERGVLVVQVENSVWAQELSLLKPQLLKKLEARLGEDGPKDVRFHSRTHI